MHFELKQAKVYETLKIKLSWKQLQLNEMASLLVFAGGAQTDVKNI